MSRDAEGFSDPMEPDTKRDLWAFVVLAFVFSWAVSGLLGVFADYVVSVGVAIPLGFLVMASPALAAVLLTKRRSGWRGVGLLLGKLGTWRAPALCYIAVVFNPRIIAVGLLSLLHLLDAKVPQIGFAAIDEGLVATVVASAALEEVTCPRNRYQSLFESWHCFQGVGWSCLEGQA